MFKSIIGLTVGCIAVAGSLGMFDGYKEITVPVGDEYGSIVCEVVGVDDGSYIQCENVYNEDDTIWIDKEYGTNGNLLHITFEHDNVYKVDHVTDYKLIVKGIE